MPKIASSDRPCLAEVAQPAGRSDKHARSRRKHWLSDTRNLRGQAHLALDEVLPVVQIAAAHPPLLCIAGHWQASLRSPAPSVLQGAGSVDRPEHAAPSFVPDSQETEASLAQLQVVDQVIKLGNEEIEGPAPGTLRLPSSPGTGEDTSLP